jgi:hypothetical protein
MSLVTKNLVFILVVSSVLFAMNFLAIKADLYWTTDWADIISHTLGGMMLGGVIIFLISLSKAKNNSKLIQVLLFALCVGVAWEFFEVYTGMNALTDPGYWSDTLSDIFFDMFGSYLASVFLKRGF